IAWALGRIPAGATTGAIISGLDCLPTFCSLAGIEPPAGVELDGRDISAVLTAGAPTPHDELLLFNNEDIVGIRTQRWKYITHSYYRGLTLDFERRGYPQLYDMSRAEPESYSVAETYPDVTRDMQDRVQRGREAFAPFKRGVPPFILEMIRKGQQRFQD
ncbi:MAG: hypothetical protein ACM3S1_02370, partial [Hyphomicrobiales bacterium]